MLILRNYFSFSWGGTEEKYKTLELGCLAYRPAVSLAKCGCCPLTEKFSLCICYHASWRAGHACSRTVSLTKQQFVVTSTIPALPDRCCPPKCCTHKTLLLLYFRKKPNMLQTVDLIVTCQVVSVTCKIVCRWVTTYFSFIRVMLKGVLPFFVGYSCPGLRDIRMYGTVPVYILIVLFLYPFARLFSAINNCSVYCNIRFPNRSR